MPITAYGDVVLVRQMPEREGPGSEVILRDDSGNEPHGIIISVGLSSAASPFSVGQVIYWNRNYSSIVVDEDDLELLIVPLLAITAVYYSVPKKE